jgi:hypothetical protein
METKTFVIVAVIIVAIAAVAIAPTLINLALAKQTATITCEQTKSGKSSSGGCSGSSEKSPNKVERCTAKNKGQTNKLC